MTSFYCVACAAAGWREPFFTREEYIAFHRDGNHGTPPRAQEKPRMARPTQKQAKEMALARMAEIAAYDDLEEAHRDRDQLMIDLLSLFAPEVADAINADEDRVALPDGESGYGYAWAVRQ